MERGEKDALEPRLGSEYENVVTGQLNSIIANTTRDTNPDDVNSNETTRAVSRWLQQQCWPTVLRGLPCQPLVDAGRRVQLPVEV